MRTSVVYPQCVRKWFKLSPCTSVYSTEPPTINGPLVPRHFIPLCSPDPLDDPGRRESGAEGRLSSVPPSLSAWCSEV